MSEQQCLGGRTPCSGADCKTVQAGEFRNVMSADKSREVGDPRQRAGRVFGISRSLLKRLWHSPRQPGRQVRAFPGPYVDVGMGGEWFREGLASSGGRQPMFR